MYGHCFFLALNWHGRTGQGTFRILYLEGYVWFFFFVFSATREDLWNAYIHIQGERIGSGVDGIFSVVHGAEVRDCLYSIYRERIELRVTNDGGDKCTILFPVKNAICFFFFLFFNRFVYKWKLTG